MSDIGQSYQIFGLKPGASLEEVKQAYRDLADVWHPDRFAHNPRLKQRAQEQLEINTAYQQVKVYQHSQASSPKTESPDRPETQYAQSKAPSPKTEPDQPKTQYKSQNPQREGAWQQQPQSAEIQNCWQGYQGLMGTAKVLAIFGFIGLFIFPSTGIGLLSLAFASYVLAQFWEPY